jgi:hypothetical protein
MLGEGQLIKELKLGGVNHDGMRKWVKTMYMPKKNHISQGDIPITKGGGYHLKPTSRI